MLFRSYNINVDVVDPHASAKEVDHEYGLQLKASAEAGAYDAIILAVAHETYRSMTEADFKKLMRHKNGIFADLKGLFRGQINQLEYWSL